MSKRFHQICDALVAIVVACAAFVCFGMLSGYMSLLIDPTGTSPAFQERKLAVVEPHFVLVTFVTEHKDPSFQPDLSDESCWVKSDTDKCYINPFETVDNYPGRK